MCYYLSGFLCTSVVHGIWVTLVGAGNDVNLARSQNLMFHFVSVNRQMD
jgi:hypothetical protein